MKSVGEAMAIGRTFKEAFLKAVRSLELGRSSGSLFPSGPDDTGDDEEDETSLRKRLVVPNDRRMWALFRALRRGWIVETLHDLTKIDPWFLQQFARDRRAAEAWPRSASSVKCRRTCCERSSAAGSATPTLPRCTASTRRWCGSAGAKTG